MHLEVLYMFLPNLKLPSKIFGKYYDYAEIIRMNIKVFEISPKN